ncbi:DUF4286 family protein [Paracoccus beibuensis]|uniref:DUF4286 family protein n=1 Tax=Paracoccus beibuensis TaxID=547602 RepID=UPI00223EB585|nr:DUF4286 family protein [Paracoccus beibuensis]
MTPLRGQGVLAIWNGIAPGHDAEFLRWHVGEHIPERLSVPGFRRARRYVALKAEPAYFNFYEVDDPSVLSSSAYLARLNDPTPWTQSVVPYFTDTARTLCRVADSRGHGVGRAMVALRLPSPETPALSALVAELVADPDICAVHLLEQAEAPAASTREQQMRAQPDETVAAILLIEGADPQAVAQAADRLADDTAITRAIGALPLRRGLYTLDFLMDCPLAAHDHP